MIDAHHHIWRQADLPWLAGPERPRIFGPYAPIRRDYTVEEYLGDIAGTGIGRSVYVQANWAPDRWADEISWVEDVADRTGWPHAVVGFLDFTGSDVGPQLAAVRDRPRLRGFRQQYHWHENPLYRFAPDPRQFGTREVRANIARLADHGWCFELQVFPGQMEDAARLADACPEVTFVLQHAGMLEDTTETGRALWREGMRRLADRANVVTKLSALGTFIRRNDPAFIARTVRETVEIFGAERCMFGTNFPIEKLWTGLDALVAAFREAVSGLPEGQRTAIFNDTAERVYRLG